MVLEVLGKLVSFPFSSSCVDQANNVLVLAMQVQCLHETSSETCSEFYVACATWNIEYRN